MIHFDLESDSHITFGGVQEGTSLEDAVAHRVSGSFHWQVAFRGFKIGDHPLDIATSTRYILVDTGGTITTFPSEDFIKIMHKLCEGLNCYVENGWYYIKYCDLDVF